MKLNINKVTIFIKKRVDTSQKRRIFNRPNWTDLQATADGSRGERGGRDEG